MVKMVRLDVRERLDHEKISRAEGAVDDRLRAECRAEAPMALDASSAPIPISSPTRFTHLDRRGGSQFGLA